MTQRIHILAVLILVPVFLLAQRASARSQCSESIKRLLEIQRPFDICTACNLKTGKVLIPETKIVEMLRDEFKVTESDLSWLRPLFGDLTAIDTVQNGWFDRLSAAIKSFERETTAGNRLEQLVLMSLDNADDQRLTSAVLMAREFKMPDTLMVAAHGDPGGAIYINISQDGNVISRELPNKVIAAAIAHRAESLNTNKVYLNICNAALSRGGKSSFARIVGEQMPIGTEILAANGVLGMSTNGSQLIMQVERDGRRLPLEKSFTVFENKRSLFGWGKSKVISERIATIEDIDKFFATVSGENPRLKFIWLGPQSP